MAEQKTKPEPRFDGTMLFAACDKMTAEEAERFLAEKGLEKWFVAGEDERGVHLARELMVSVEELYAELNALGDEWVTSKGPRQS